MPAAKDTSYLQRALTLAKRGQGYVHPNPMVGAVIVSRGSVVGEGYHRRYGRPHAEVEALRKAGARAKGATLYLNLEPCSHWGKTPPCADAVIAAGIRRVVAAMQDPNPKVAGRGFAKLRRAGISVQVGLLEQEAETLNRAFRVFVLEKRPYVTLKAATSLDGKIATVRGESKWITGEASRREGHKLRAEADAIAVGAETVRRDDPQLSAHGLGRDPIRVVFDSRLRLSPRAKLFSSKGRVWIFTTKAASAAKRRALEKKGAAVHVMPAHRGRVDIPAALTRLAQAGITHLLVEGGGTLAASFVEQKRVDEVIWFIAPRLIGGADAKTALEGRGVARLREALALKDVSMRPLGTDFMLRGFTR
jgi:diaminohydroxyphosphoribosylaminopyrimidine deaminase / 5-amino-6-(5-phosphoribosylamino)uracil reductase